jgi:F-type H+-transporting ATPase subunit b
METFLSVFSSLGVDSSIVTQFILIALTFLGAKYLFLDELKFTLENREEKTIKLENNADETLNKVSKMMMDYKSKMDQATKDTMKSVNDKKADIVKKWDESFKVTEKEVNQQIESSRFKYEQDISQNKEKYMQEAEDLSKDLINKIIQ